VRLGEVVRPTTVIVNKATLEGDVLPRLTWGAAQLGVAQGVLDAVADGVVDAGEAAELVLLVPVWVDAAATDETAVRLANRAATRAAIENALRPPSADGVRALAARRDEATNAYYSGE
jgi:5,6,7,8-tetrahydromethanopterin hydro-lyase